MGPRRIWLHADEFEALCLVLESMIDSYEKLELVVGLYRSSPRRWDLRDLSKHLGLDKIEVVEGLAFLRDIGMAAMESRGDEVRWWFDPRSTWRDTVERLSELHEIDRDELLALMKHVAVQYFRDSDQSSSLLAFSRRKRGNDAAG